MEVGDGRLQGYTFAAALLWAVLLLILAPGSKGEPAAQPGVDNDPEGAPYVAGELLVAYEPGTSEEAEKTVVRRSGARTLEDLPGEVRLVFFPAIRRQASEVVRERALARALEYLGHRAVVEAVDYNYLREPYFIPNDPRLSNQWGLTSTRFRGAWNAAKGDGAKIALVDSGVYSKHPDIGRLIAKVMGPIGFTTDSRIVQGIKWSVNNGADVVNLSLGGSGDSSVLSMAINRAYGQGAVVVAAAGNEGTNVPQYPAAYSKVIAVSATTTDGRLASFSNRGDWVDLAAPGTDILSTSKSGGYQRRSGTSMAAPFVSGLAGLLASRGMSADSIRQRMQTTAKDLGPVGDDPRFGHGRIDADNAVR